MNKNLKPRSAYRLQVGRNIRLWRDLKGMKQQELAGRIGITAAALSQIENDIARLTLHRVEDIADALGVYPEQLIAGPSQGSGTVSSATDKEMLARLLHLLENLNNYFSGNTR